ncbi:murein L,D-transpeptidase catalytic domain family protein [Taibaiella koreensis]|uniref:murein L,D-transpeptidase catalytic domain family protein n=1 Tax=Taibaiella koreensis TaxID=1268548 RepID=UPI000E59D071|nr:murein L,D-transpeptidase catalytic domain family protein [Taibaiella koreensis]
MQKIRVGLLMIVMCASSFFVQVVKGEENSRFNNPRTGVNQKADQVYNQIDFGKNEPLSREVFRKAYTGYLNLKEAGKLDQAHAMLSICDFSLSANVKRLWVIDLERARVMFHTLVAHGQGTGEEFAVNFSNRENSHQSSLGFYVTEETYDGDNGYSLKLNGMDNGYNDAAYSRAIVMHGADYVCESYIRDNKRLGRSWGCPAIPVTQSKAIINTIKEGTCLYIYYPSRAYLAQSVWLNRMPQVSEDELIKGEFQKLNKQSNNPAMVTRTLAQADSNLDVAPPASQLPSYQGVQLAVGAQ